MTRLLQLLQEDTAQALQVAPNVLKEEATWQQSHHQFRKHLAEEYAAFPDVVVPLQAAILQLQHGVRLVASEVHRMMFSSFVPPAKLSTLVASLLSFPSVGSTFPTYLSQADALCSVNSLDVLHGLKRLSSKYSAEDADREQRMCLTQEQLLVNALLYLHCHVLSQRELDHKSLKLLRHLCQVWLCIFKEHLQMPLLFFIDAGWFTVPKRQIFKKSTLIKSNNWTNTKQK